MKLGLTLKSAAVAVLMTSLTIGFSQNFTNLDFEAANPTGYAPGSDIPVSAALPGWTLTFGTPGVGTNNVAMMVYDAISLGGAAVSVNDTNTEYGFVPLQRRYSAYLFGGRYGAQLLPTYVTISQMGIVPVGTLSMTMEVNAQDFSVAINGQRLNMVSLSSHSLPYYTVFGADVSAFAGDTVQLSITAPPGLPNMVLLDNIRFSSAPLSYPPIILAPPTNQTALAYATVAFSVTASGYTLLSYQWLHDGSNVSAQATNSVLVLSNALAPLAGGYSVIISNSYGSVTSQVAMLTVLDPFITNTAVNPTGLPHAGQTVNLSVAAIGSTPLSYQWLKNGAVLLNGGHITGSDATMLTISNASGADSGLYSVVVSNGFGSVTNSVDLLNIEDPFLASGPVSQAVNVGATASFGVTAGGTPSLTYQWYDAGAVINDTGNISGSHTATLTLSNVLAGDADIYYAVVSNVFGSVTSSVAYVSVIPSDYSILNMFTNFGGGALVASGNMLYGTVPGDNYVFSIDTQGSNFTALHTFTPFTVDGSDPGVLLITGSTLFGTTFYGGGTNNDGTVFKMNTDGGGFATLHTFNGGGGDGAYPRNFILSDGTLYGTTGGGGSGNGVLFKLTADGSNYQVLATFAASNGSPVALVASAGMLYGLTVLSATGGYTSTLYQMDTNGNQYAQLAQWQGAASPATGLLLAGTALYGVASSVGLNSGAIFRINTDGRGLTVLKTFAPGIDGYYPIGELILNGSMLYGTTQSGGISGYGTLFRISTNGSDFTVLKRFHGGSDGAGGAWSLALSGSTLYGVTGSGGSGAGVLFSYSLQGLAGTMTPPVLIPGGYQLGFSGIRGLAYSVQRAPLVIGPWTTFTNVVVGSGGMATCLDTNAPPGAAFYRTKYP